MITTPCALWRRVPADAGARLRQALERGAARCLAEHGRPPLVFFRADDVAAPSRSWDRFVALFLRWRVPLACAATPAWLTPARWERLREGVASAPALFCWHQHGRTHRNHEAAGKKMEFGPARSREAKERDLLAGRERLAAILGPAFAPWFTPPWNRCDAETLALLAEHGYAGLSRFRGARPASPLPEAPATLDLHTRKDADAVMAWPRLLEELEASLAAGALGVMCHHQRCNAAALVWLDELLSLLADPPAARPWPRLVSLPEAASPPDAATLPSPVA